MGTSLTIHSTFLGNAGINKCTSILNIIKKLNHVPVNHRIVKAGKEPPRSLNPAITLAPLCSELNHVPKCHSCSLKKNS